jgi:hypothetical protein
VYTIPGSPRVLKGAIVTIDSKKNKIISTIPFQYNPDTLTRTLQPQFSSEENTRTEALRIEGAPGETLKLEIEIDATDDLAAARTSEELVIQQGIYPHLAALEILVYPDSNYIRNAMDQADEGTIEIIPPEAPLTLFVWGKQRVMPVRITEFSITEEAHDVNLNPIRAKVSLGMRVLSYNDLPWRHTGSQLFFVHHQDKENAAKKFSIKVPAAITDTVKANVTANLKRI